MYREGFDEEGLISYAGSPSQPIRSDGASRVAAPAASPGSHEHVLDEQVHRDGGATITERVIHNDLSHRPGEFAAVGIKERTLRR